MDIHGQICKNGLKMKEEISFLSAKEVLEFRLGQNLLLTFTT